MQHVYVGRLQNGNAGLFTSRMLAMPIPNDKAQDIGWLLAKCKVWQFTLVDSNDNPITGWEQV